MALAAFVICLYTTGAHTACRDFAKVGGGGGLLRHAGQLADHVVEDAAVAVVGQLRLSIKP